MVLIIIYIKYRNFSVPAMKKRSILYFLYNLLSRTLFHSFLWTPSSSRSVSSFFFSTRFCYLRSLHTSISIYLSCLNPKKESHFTFLLVTLRIFYFILFWISLPVFNYCRFPSVSRRVYYALTQVSMCFCVFNCISENWKLFIFLFFDLIYRERLQRLVFSPSFFVLQKKLWLLSLSLTRRSELDL